MSSTVDDHVDVAVRDRYNITRKLGKGAYGVVYKAIDRATGEMVAVKKVFDAFQNATDAQRTFREVLFLQELVDHPNIIRLIDVMAAENHHDLYLVFEYMASDLQTVMRAGVFEDVHRRYTIHQLLKVLEYMHSGNIIHRDLKPSNLLIDSDCLIRVADFGLARSVATINNSRTKLTDYVATRWYRSPEILLGSRKYTTGIDIWSFGCILAELVIGKPLFAGSSLLDQVEKIAELLGMPLEADVKSIQSSSAPSVLKNVRIRVSRTWERTFKGVPADALDLVRKTLVWDPKKRISAADALRHPYVSLFYNPNEQIPLFNKDIIIALDDNVKFSIDDYRTKLYGEVVKKYKAASSKRNETWVSSRSNSIQKGRNIVKRNEKTQKHEPDGIENITMSLDKGSMNIEGAQVVSHRVYDDGTILSNVIDGDNNERKAAHDPPHCKSGAHIGSHLSRPTSSASNPPWATNLSEKQYTSPAKLPRPIQQARSSSSMSNPPWATGY